MKSFSEYARAHALLMMRCRPGILQTSSRAALGACGGPGSEAHRRRRQVYAVCASLTALPPRAEIMKAVVYALALHRIRDTAALARAPLVGWL